MSRELELLARASKSYDLTRRFPGLPPRAGDPGNGRCWPRDEPGLRCRWDHSTLLASNPAAYTFSGHWRPGTDRRCTPVRM